MGESLDKFISGYDETDIWIGTHARPTKRDTAVFVHPPMGDVKGMFALRSDVLSTAGFPRALKTNDRGVISYPAIYLACMALAERERGEGFGKLLLLEAARTAVEANLMSPARYFHLTAGNLDLAEKFYEKAEYLKRIGDGTEFVQKMSHLERELILPGELSKIAPDLAA